MAKISISKGQCAPGARPSYSCYISDVLNPGYFNLSEDEMEDLKQEIAKAEAERE